MRIGRLETFCNRHIGFVRMTAEDGATAGAGLDLQCRHHAPSAAPPGGALGARRRGSTLDALTDRVDRAGAQVPGLLHEARDGRPRHGDLGPSRQEARGSPSSRCSAARLGELRAYASSMGGDITPEDEAERLTGCRASWASTPSSSASAPNAAMTSTNGRAGPRTIVPAMRARWATRQHCWSTPTAASRLPAPSRSADAGGQRRRAFRGALPLLGAGADKAGDRGAELAVTGGEQDCEIPTWRHMIEMRAVDVVQPDILYSAASAARCGWRDGRAAGLPVTPHAANLGAGDAVHHASAEGASNAGKYLEFSIEGPRLLSLAGRPVRDVSLSRSRPAT